MWQIYGEKEMCGTKGGLVSKWKQSMKHVVTTNGKKSAEVIVPLWYKVILIYVQKILNKNVQMI